MQDKENEMIYETDRKYVLKTQERNLIPSKDIFYYLRRGIWWIIAIILFGSILFGDNLFLEMSKGTRLVLIGLVISSFTWKRKKDNIPSNVELWFYEDYFIVYREKTYYNNRVSRLQYFKFSYSDIKNITYDFFLKRLNIYGNVEATWYNYKKDGTISANPNYHRLVNGTMCWLYVYGNDYRDIIGALEKYTGQKLILKQEEFENNNSEINGFDEKN